MVNGVSAKKKKKKKWPFLVERNENSMGDAKKKD